ncbi:MAG: hypothetical protein JXQ83_02820, partial [Candidatus Glassbacteria bacterium]|nr:hypothetical protein [Candidatus Glassbacteria bacterium]
HVGVVNLYTREFYSLCRRSLAEKGLFCQWLPVNQIPYAECLSLIKAFCEVFPGAGLWYGAGADLLLVGGAAPVKVSLPELDVRFSAEAVAQDLEAIGVRSVYQLLALLNAGASELNRLSGYARPTTDNFPSVEYAGPAQGAELQKNLALCRMSGDPAGLIDPRGWGEDSSRAADSLYQAVENTAALRSYAVGLRQDPDGRWYFAGSFPLDAPLLKRMPDNRYLLYLLGVDVPVVAGAFLVSENIEKAPSGALRVLGKHFFYRGDLERAWGCFTELYQRQVRDREVSLFLSYIKRARENSGN